MLTLVDRFSVLYRPNLFQSIHLLSALTLIHFTIMNMEIALHSTGVQNPVVLNIHPENQDHNMVCSQVNPKYETNIFFGYFLLPTHRILSRPC